VTLPKNVDDLYPLTPMQRLMLLHAISAAGNGVLLNQVSYDIRGAFDPGRISSRVGRGRRSAPRAPDRISLGRARAAAPDRSHFGRGSVSHR
jgi:hypothetical protein